MIFCTKLYLDKTKKKCSKRISIKNSHSAVFRRFSSFLAKNQVFELFLQNRTSKFHITCSKARNNCFQSFNGSVVSGKILVLAVLTVLALFWSKIHCLWWQIEVLTIFDQFLPICWCLFDNFCFLNQVYGLRRDKVNLGFDKKNLVIFWPCLVQNLAIFAQKSGFWLFSWKPLIRISCSLVRNSRQLLSII